MERFENLRHLFRRDDSVQTSVASERGRRLPHGSLRDGCIVTGRVRDDIGTAAQLQRVAGRNVRRAKLDQAVDQSAGPLSEHQVRDGRSRSSQPRFPVERVPRRSQGGGDLREELRDGQFGGGGGRGGTGDRRDRAEERYSTVDREGGEAARIEENLDSVAPRRIERRR